MSRPLFAAVTILDAGEGSCRCGQPAIVLITRARLNVEERLCGICYRAYELQSFKNEGIELPDIQEEFSKLSAALDAPISRFVM